MLSLHWPVCSLSVRLWHNFSTYLYQGGGIARCRRFFCLFGDDISLSLGLRAKGLLLFAAALGFGLKRKTRPYSRPQIPSAALTRLKQFRFFTAATCAPLFRSSQCLLPAIRAKALIVFFLDSHCFVSPCCYSSAENATFFVRDCRGCGYFIFFVTNFKYLPLMRQKYLYLCIIFKCF